MNSLGGNEGLGQSRAKLLGAGGMIVVLALAVLALVSINDTTRAAESEPADKVFKNGRVLLFPDAANKPMSDEVAFAQAVAVTDDKISYVGDDAGVEDQVGPDTEVVDLGGRMLMPGLGDGHLHGGTPPACDLKYEGGTFEASEVPEGGYELRFVVPLV